MLKTPPSFLPLHSARPHDEAYSFIFRGDELLVHATHFLLPDAAACSLLGVTGDATHAVGLWQERYCRTAWVGRDAEAAPGYEFRKLRSLFGTLDDAMMAIAGRAYQIAEWARTHRYCGACAAPMEVSANEHCMQCRQCGMTAYPRISPAMMVLIKKGDAILLARHAQSPTGRYSALAGFLEPGESVEDAIHREVFEEVGLKVRDLRYFGSQSWPFPHSLMIAFTAEYESGEIAPDPNEIAEARWYGPEDELPPIPFNISIAYALINAHLPRMQAKP
ncbi:MAG TPA: NAD(+) diphosphatase [Paucimonas sp.]|nr:NAD(+) diphosphatase [Paucimonas sp.]